jgi:hypothetical protein
LRSADSSQLWFAKLSRDRLSDLETGQLAAATIALCEGMENPRFWVACGPVQTSRFGCPKRRVSVKSIATGAVTCPACGCAREPGEIRQRSADRGDVRGKPLLNFQIRSATVETGQHRVASRMAQLLCTRPAEASFQLRRESDIVRGGPFVRVGSVFKPPLRCPASNAVSG